MKRDGALKPGEVSGGQRQQTRGDLMCWVSTNAGEPKPLFQLLAAIDELIAALAQQPLLQPEPGMSMLVRHEMQVTCYPGNGSRYVKHVDDAFKHGSRRLTCIYYANPEWKDADGGVLRLHLKRLEGAHVDVAPVDGRLLIFWSDSRVPHEVLPSYKDRFAVSVWFSDASALQRAAAAEQNRK